MLVDDNVDDRFQRDPEVIADELGLDVSDLDPEMLSGELTREDLEELYEEIE